LFRGKKDTNMQTYITNLLASLVHSKFAQNLLFHKFEFFTHWCHVSKTCMIHFSKLKILVENISLYLYVHHTCFEHMMSICKKNKNKNPWNKTFAWFPLSIMGWKVHDVWIKESTSSLTKISLMKIKFQDRFITWRASHLF
jgi:hypothetical protein